MFDLRDLAKHSREVAAVDVSAVADDELLAAAVGLEAIRSTVEVTQARLLGEIAVRRLTDQRYGQPVARWVAAEANVDRSGVHRRMKLGRRVRRLPAVDQAVVAGELSVDHGAVLAEHVANPRVGDQIEATQAYWVERAATTTFADWKHQVELTVAQLDQDGGYDPNRDLARNKLRITPLPDGSIGLTGELVGEQALVVRDCVEAHADRLFHRLKRDHELCPELPLPHRSTLLAMALAELVLRGSTVDLDNSRGPVTDVTLVIEATRPATPDPVLTQATDPTGMTGVGAASSLVLPPHADLDLASGVDAASPPADQVAVAELLNPYATLDRSHRVGLMDLCGPVTTPNGHHVPDHIAAVLLCDPAIHALIVDSLGVALDLGRTTRYANRDQRRALAKRDGGCVFPGCDSPVGWCDAHHVIDWHYGGRTDMANLALLCRYHHGVTHRAGWTMTAQPDQTFTWHTPLGQTLHSQRHRGRSPTGRAA